MPNDTSNILSYLWDFVRDDLLPGQATGDTVWHFKIKTVNDEIPHYVNDCHFFSLTGLGFSIENAGGINRTTNGGITWEQVYSGTEPLNSICMVTDTSGYVVGEKGTVIKLGSHSSGLPDYPNNSLNVNIFPSPATNRITIEREGNSSPATLIIVNGSGQSMITRQINGSKVNIDISPWPAGIYFVTVRQDQKIAVQRIIKEAGPSK